MDSLEEWRNPEGGGGVVRKVETCISNLRSRSTDGKTHRNVFTKHSGSNICNAFVRWGFGHTWQTHPANYSFYLQQQRRVPLREPAEQNKRQKQSTPWFKDSCYYCKSLKTNNIIPKHASSWRVCGFSHHDDSSLRLCFQDVALQVFRRSQRSGARAAAGRAAQAALLRDFHHILLQQPRNRQLTGWATGLVRI